MSLQVFLQAQLLGTEEFLARRDSGVSSDTADMVGRCAWLSLFGEVLPRALLRELRVSRMLLGSSSAEQFLLVLAEEHIAPANQSLTRAAEAVSRLSGSALRLVWATTENLGPWPIARKRLDDALQARIAAPLADASESAQAFTPFETGAAGDRAVETFFEEFARDLTTADSIGWSSAQPARLTWGEGDYTWPLREQAGPEEDAIVFPRRFAADESGSPASPQELAGRAEGAALWGILRGDVDQLGSQLKRLGSIEEHIHVSILFKEFFAGELALLCTLPNYWRKVSVLYRGGDDFAVIGAWDALLALSRELHRLFERFAEENLESISGFDARSLSMALAIAPETGTSVAAVMQRATAELRDAKTSETGSFFLFGRSIEWKRLDEAEELKTSLVRLVRDFGYPPAYISDVAAVYRESLLVRVSRRRAARLDKPWRMYMRLSRVIPQFRGKEANNLRNTVITSLIGKRAAGLKLRPSARVGLEWARLAAGVN